MTEGSPDAQHILESPSSCDDCRSACANWNKRRLFVVSTVTGQGSWKLSVLREHFSDSLHQLTTHAHIVCGSCGLRIQLCGNCFAANAVSRDLLPWKCCGCSYSNADGRVREVLNTQPPIPKDLRETTLLLFEIQGFDYLRAKVEEYENLQQTISNMSPLESDSTPTSGKRKRSASENPLGKSELEARMKLEKHMMRCRMQLAHLKNVTPHFLLDRMLKERGFMTATASISQIEALRAIVRDGTSGLQDLKLHAEEYIDQLKELVGRAPELVKMKKSWADAGYCLQMFSNTTNCGGAVEGVKFGPVMASIFKERQSRRQATFASAIEHYVPLHALLGEDLWTCMKHLQALVPTGACRDITDEHIDQSAIATACLLVTILGQLFRFADGVVR